MIIILKAHVKSVWGAKVTLTLQGSFAIQDALLSGSFGKEKGTS